MVVISLTDCPPALRGDLSKWLLEISTGVYVGQVSARVRDELWDRIIKNIKNGRAAMVFDAANEQKMDFRIHNTSWELVDCDGLRLVRRPSEERIKQTMEAGEKPGLSPGFSKAAKQQIQRRAGTSQKRVPVVSDYTVVDVETTGLDARKDSIIEMGALRVRNWEPVAEFNVLVQVASPVPAEISTLTGLTDYMLQKEGIPHDKALARLMDFIGDDVLLIHNAPFDLGFLNEAAAKAKITQLKNRTMDTCALSRRGLLKVPDYRLETLAAYFHIDQPVQHRALPDCRTAHAVYRALAQTAN